MGELSGRIAEKTFKMRKGIIFFSFFLIIPNILTAQDITVPDEEISGEDLRIEKTEILIKSPSVPDIIFPSLPVLPEEPVHEDPSVYVDKEEHVPDYEAEEVLSEPKGVLSIFAGSYSTVGMGIDYSFPAGQYEHVFSLDAFSSDGYRHNDREARLNIGYSHSGPESFFSSRLGKGYMDIPGTMAEPLNIERDYLSFSTDYRKSFRPGLTAKLGQVFYDIDGLKSNLSSAGIELDKSDVLFKTEFERYDVFEDKISRMSLFQGVYRQGENFKIGGGVKKIENYDFKLLPFVKVKPLENILFELQGFYRMPDFREDVILSNYKDSNVVLFPPEEGYSALFAFERNTGNLKFNSVLKGTYFKNGYTWKENGSLLEPFASEYSTVSLGADIQYAINRHSGIFFKGLKILTDDDIYYYPSEKYDAGFSLDFQRISAEFWASHKGRRTFADETLGGYTTLNALLTFSYSENTEISAGFYNIGGREYELIPGYPGPGRSFKGFVKIRF